MNFSFSEFQLLIIQKKAISYTYSVWYVVYHISNIYSIYISISNNISNPLMMYLLIFFPQTPIGGLSNKRGRNLTQKISPVGSRLSFVFFMSSVFYFMSFVCIPRKSSLQASLEIIQTSSNK